MATKSGGYRPHFACQVSYELGLILFAVILPLVFLQSFFTRHGTIDHIINSSHFSAPVPGASGLRVGQRLPIYRYTRSLQSSLGDAVVDSVKGDRVTFSYDPKELSYPLGAQGRVTGTRSGFVHVDLGNNQGLFSNRPVFLFDGRDVIGQINVTATGPDDAWGTLASFAGRNLIGTPASVFSVATQVTVIDAPLIGWIDAAVLCAVLLGYLWGWLAWRESPLIHLGPRIRRLLTPDPRLHLPIHTLIGLAGICFLVPLGFQCISYVADQFTLFLFHRDIPDWMSGDRLTAYKWPVIVALLAIYEWKLVTTGDSPFVLLWKRLGFRGGVFGHAAKTLPEHLTMWLMNLVIVYAFAHVIFAGMIGDLSVALSQGWPYSLAPNLGSVNPLSWECARMFWETLRYVFTHAPQFQNLDGVFTFLRMTVFALCIVGGLFGYWFGVLAYLWGKRIRNIDFTPVGWFVNGICYGPTLGNALGALIPSASGIDPIVTAGPLFVAIPCIELFTNVVYTLTIFNLGTKFGLMTDKGMRTTGYYSVVRHPSYTIEGPVFITIYLAGFSGLGQWLWGLSFILFYWIRSERDEDFMSKSNPEYEPYRQAVPYKFIPGVY